MRVADIRDITMTPAAFNSKTVTAWFNQTGTPSSTWYAGITVKGWTDGYAAWQLCANSTVNTADTNLYFRIGINSSFQAWQKILTDANYASMLDGRYVNTAGDEMTGDLAVRKMHLQGGNEFNCDDKLWIAYRSTPQGVNVCHADQPFTYGSAGHEVLHRGNYSNLVNALNQPLTIRCGNDAKLIFDNTDGERYTVLSFREAGAEYANIIANSEAFVFSGKPVTIGSSLTTPYINGVLDMKMERNLFFKHSSSTTGIYFSAQSDGSLSIRAHSGYSYAKTIGTISYGGNFGIGTTSPQWPIDVHGGVRCDDWFRTTGNGGWYSQTHGGGMYMRNSTWVEAYNKPVKIAHRTAIGCSGFGVGLQLRDDNHTAVEVCGGNTTMGMGCHKDGRWYWWRGTTDPAATSDKKYVMNFDGGTWDFKGRLHATGAVYSDTAIGGKGLPSTSDKRLKTIVADVVLPLDTVAGAPLKSFFWNDGKDMAARCGTVAQYWERLLPEVVYKQPDGYLAVDYGALAHAEAVTVARELVRLRQRVEALEHENRKLKRITGNA
jgi:hypothetical protein